MWNRWQGVEDMVEAISASDEDMAVLDGKNAADHPGGMSGLVGPSWSLHHPSGAKDLLVPSRLPSRDPLPPCLSPKKPNSNH